MTSRFTLDKESAKLMGVCAGLARSLDSDPFLVRMGLVLACLALGPVTLLLYFVAGWAAPEASASPE